MLPWEIEYDCAQYIANDWNAYTCTCTCTSICIHSTCILPLLLRFLLMPWSAAYASGAFSISVQHNAHIQKNSTEKTFALIKCVAEKSLSVVCCQKVSGGYWRVGDVPRVNTGEGTF